MANDFCRYLSNGYSFNILSHPTKALVKPCCWFNSAYDLDSNFENARIKISNITDWTLNCNKCKNLEQVGQQSLRQTGPDWINETDHYDPVRVDFMLENTCNAACIICSEDLSSLWGKENQKLHQRKFKIVNQDDNVDGKLEKIFTNFKFDKLRYIKFFGGEPLFTDTHIKILEKIPDPENVTVHYTTNGSIFPNDRTLEVWKKFHTIIFAASIDGVGKQFDYIRWPLKWDKVQRNLFNLRDSKIHNLMFRVEFTANFLNIWYFDSVEEWVNKHFAENLHSDKTDLNMHLYHGKIFNLEFLNTELKNAILEKYCPQSKAFKVINPITPKSNFIPFWNFAETWDERRKLQWQDCFLEIRQYIDKM